MNAAWKLAAPWLLSIFLLSTCCSAQAPDKAEKNDQAGLRLFETDVRPALVKHCYRCHSAERGKTESSLALDSKQGLRRGGDRGPAVVPGKPQQSLLLTAIAHGDPDLQMPPEQKRLPAATIKAFTDWIRLGATDPRTAEAPRPTLDLEEARKFWSYRQPRRPALPQVDRADWPAGEIDRIVLARLEAAGLQPSEDAEPQTLVRRLHFDLAGLPPTPAARRRFLEQVDTDGLQVALEAEVDRLLASQQFGERWGRHWLDVARFAESSGKEANITFPYAWRYRDYVIDCFNDDKPLDEFLVEQIAGDLLPHDSPQERARLLIATGFLAVGPKNLDAANKLQFLADTVDEQIDTISRAVIANSVACARCHDHKFDPFTMQDYYALAGVLASTKTYFGTHVSPSNRNGGDPLPLPPDAGQPILHRSVPQRRVTALKQEQQALKEEEREGRAAVRKAIREGRDASEIFTLRDALRIFWRSGAIEGQLEKVDERGQALPLAMGVLDREQVIDAPLLLRGEISRPGERVPRGFPAVIAVEGHEIPDEESGRLQLAHWLTDPNHPLTARVMANRLWRHLLGAGIVSTMDNFGTTGSPPSHPRLLDYLALRLVDSDWSAKQLIREIALSRTYRQASTFNSQAFEADPDNRLLWRASKRRLEAEAIRDAMLQASGDLDAARPLGSLVGRVIGDRPVSLVGLDKRLPKDLDGARHRSVYLPVLRDRLPDVLDLFDFAEPSLVTGDRQPTNVPVQALYLMNSPFVQSRAESLSGRVIREADRTSSRISLAFLLCFAREPERAERERAERFFKPVENSEKERWTMFCQALLATAEFRLID